MLIDTNPYNLHKGKIWLAYLREATCDQFAVYVDYIVQGIEACNYTYAELGVSAEEVLDLGIYHAGEATKSGKDTILNLAKLNALALQRDKLKAASKPHLPDTSNTIDLETVRQQIHGTLAA